MQRSLGLMALDVANNSNSSKPPQRSSSVLTSSPEPSPPSSAPCSPREAMLGLAAFPLYSPVLQLKAVADGASRFLALQQKAAAVHQIHQQQQHLQQHLQVTSSQPSPPAGRRFPGSSPSPQSLHGQSPQPSLPSPLQLLTAASATATSTTTTTGRSKGNHHSNHHHHHHSHHHHKSLKFSIDNILSPAFGKNGEPLGPLEQHLTHQQVQQKQEERKSVKANKGASGHNHGHHGGSSSSSSRKTSNGVSFDISSLTAVEKKQATSSLPISKTVTAAAALAANSKPSHVRPQPVGKRKNSSDSESSTTSSTFSVTSSEKAASSKSAKASNGGKRSTDSSENSSNALPPLNNKPSLSIDGKDIVWPAWVYCTRYSDRPSSGPRSRRSKKKEKKAADEKRPRTAFTAEQLNRLKQEFTENRYLTEKRRQDLANALKLNESQIKIWFQNKRAKIKKATGSRNPLAIHLMAQGLYNHTTASMADEDEEPDLDVDKDDSDVEHDAGASCSSGEANQA